MKLQLGFKERSINSGGGLKHWAFYQLIITEDPITGSLTEIVPDIDNSINKFIKWKKKSSK